MHIRKILITTAFTASLLGAPALAQNEGADSVPPPTIDTNGDGTPDAWDRDGDGSPDAWDTTGDGMPDQLDQDGDGQPDAQQ